MRKNHPPHVHDSNPMALRRSKRFPNDPRLGTDDETVETAEGHLQEAHQVVERRGHRGEVLKGEIHPPLHGKKDFAGGVSLGQGSLPSIHLSPGYRVRKTRFASQFRKEPTKRSIQGPGIDCTPAKKNFEEKRLKQSFHRSGIITCSFIYLYHASFEMPENSVAVYPSRRD